LQAYVLKTFAAEIEAGILITDGPDIATLPTMSYRTMMPVLDRLRAADQAADRRVDDQ
jgi:siderophore synthetase component